MDHPSVAVEEITNENARELVMQHAPHGVNLGDEIKEHTANDRIAGTRRAGGRRFLLRWTGHKVPRGAVVLGHEIVWTQNGQVQAKRGAQLANVGGNMFFGGTDIIGTYDRLVEFGGESGEEQMMIVYTHPQCS